MKVEDNVLFRSFGRDASGHSIRYTPKNPKEVRDVFDIAKASGKFITIRGGGHSFHDQALHDGDCDSQIVLSPDAFNTIPKELGGDTVKLGAGVKWIDYFNAAREYAAKHNAPLRLPGSMQTGRKATVGGTLAGDCLSRFSGAIGKESRWIESFRIMTPSGGSKPIEVNAKDNPELFNAVVGGHGYLGFVTDATYKLIAIDPNSCARTRMTTYENFDDLVAAQLQIIKDNQPSSGPTPPRAVSSAWFTDLSGIFTGRIKSGVFDSTYSPPSSPPALPYPLYDSIDSGWRTMIEITARTEPLNTLIHEYLYLVAKDHKDYFENDLLDFLFFMDGNTVAKERFEARFDELFPIVQQTFVIPAEKTADFAKYCERQMAKHVLRPTETDMLFVDEDECLMSANYHLKGFAVTIAFEPIAANGKTPDEIKALLIELSKHCADIGGRIHVVKNVYADPADFRKMFSDMNQIEQFEKIKKTYDPDLILQNGFSANFFQFV